jgi:8-oxo-dGTP pyrophosphatase MutT (NUDIX family)
MAVRVIACVISHDSEFRVCQRPLSKRHGGEGEFPGGKVEADESDEAAARRELLKELGVEMISASDVSFSMSDPESPYQIVFMPVSVRGPICTGHIDL